MNLKHFILSIAGVLFATSFAVAGNLVQNPNFDSDVSHWTAQGGELSFDGALGEPSPGSAYLSFKPPFIAVNSDCFIVDPSKTYDLSANIYVNAGSGGFLYVFYFAGPACAGEDVELGGVGFNGNPMGEWRSLSAQNLSISNGAVGSAWISIWTQVNDSFAYVHLDSVFFGPHDPIFDDGFGD